MEVIISDHKIEIKKLPDIVAIDTLQDFDGYFLVNFLELENRIVIHHRSPSV